jgi:methionine--tRNA ligase beta chain
MLDIRVGRIEQALKLPDSEKLYWLDVDFGFDLRRKIATGLQKHYQHEEMKGLAIVILNVKPRRFMGYESHGILLCA